MHVVFLAPAPADKEFAALQEHVKKLIIADRHSLTDGTFPSDQTRVEEHAAQLTRDIKKADAVVVEATHSNFNLGRIITLAVQQHKPVLMLQQQKHASPLIIGTSRLVQMKEYEDAEKEVIVHLKSFLKIAKKQRLTYRFNLMLSREINSYLMDQAQSSGLSKADYIRDLIVHDMEVE